MQFILQRDTHLITIIQMKADLLKVIFNVTYKVQLFITKNEITHETNLNFFSNTE